MLDNTSQLLCRHNLVDCDTLLVNALDQLPANVNGQGPCAAHYYYYNAWQKGGLESHTFGPLLTQRAKTTVLYVPKEKKLAMLLLDNLAQQLDPADTLLLVGHNRGGIRSLVKQLGDLWQPAEKVASGNHCLLYQTKLLQKPAGEFNLDSYLTRYQIADTPGLEHISAQVCSLPGVFSEQRLDDGTALLLKHLPADMSGSVLDFACGSGVVAASILSRYPEVNRVTASDVNAFALHAADATLSNYPQRSTVCPSDGLNQLSERYDWIVSNPPFHTGHRTDYAVARDFIAAVPKHLTNNGRLLIVANNFLGYPALLREQFKHVKELANDKRFHVLAASQPC